MLLDLNKELKNIIDHKTIKIIIKDKQINKYIHTHIYIQIYVYIYRLK